MSHDPPTDPLADRDLTCPECHDATQVIDRFTLEGSPRPVEHVKVICRRGHWFTLPLQKLVTVRGRQSVAGRDEVATARKAA